MPTQKPSRTPPSRTDYGPNVAPLDLRRALADAGDAQSALDAPVQQELAAGGQLVIAFHSRRHVPAARSWRTGEEG